MSAIIQVDFFNSYVIRKVRCHSQAQTDGTTATVFMSPGVTPYQDISTGSSNRNYYIEEARIRGGFNNTSTDQGARAYLDEPFPLQQKRINTLIYSGVYNSRTGINRTNVFSIGDAITKSIDPVFGSIQKLYAEDTNLIVWQENKIHRALIDKDTIYTTESGTQTQAGAAVIGQFVPYKGEYGISKNPESFAIYNYRKYFSDKSRNAIMRLSNDGLTEISMYGMMDYFRDELATVLDDKQTTSINIPSANVIAGGGNGDIYVNITDSVDSRKITPGMTIASQNGGYVTNIQFLSNTLGSRVLYSQPFVGSVVSDNVLSFQYKTKGKVIGGWDIHNRNYLISLQKSPNQVSSDEASFETVAFDEKINGWVSFFTFKPNQMFSVLNKFYTVDEHDIYEHYTNVANNRGLFYGVREPSNVTFIFNEQSSLVKNFQTISYEGSNGWEVTSFKSGFTGQDPNPANPPVGGQDPYVQDQDVVDVNIRSYDEGLYTDTITGQPLRAGFDRKENRYVTNLISNSTVRAGEVIFGNQMSGIKGYFATVIVETDETTQLGGPKELWAAGTKYVVSSY
tara:strand:- start:1792 stop:3492 length:1701 start_codon:yes stop_codon:yes gene_type:complete